MSDTFENSMENFKRQEKFLRDHHRFEDKVFRQTYLVALEKALIEKNRERFEKEMERMKHKINPAIDCVFKAILGHEKRKHLLIHFLNSVLEYHDDPEKRITGVTIMNPYNEREFEDDKLGIVVVKARDASGRIFNAEIQIAVFPGLKKRILYNWSTLYSSQLEKGDSFRLLQPVISIWIVTGVLFPEANACHLPFYIRNAETGLLLNDDFAVHVLQLPKWQIRKEGITEKDRWIYLFKEGKNMDIANPPDILKESKEMRDAMEVLQEFSENQKNYLLYQSRFEGELVQQTYRDELEHAITETVKERIEKERALMEKEEALMEKEKALK